MYNQIRSLNRLEFLVGHTPKIRIERSQIGKSLRTCVTGLTDNQIWLLLTKLKNEQFKSTKIKLKEKNLHQETEIPYKNMLLKSTVESFLSKDHVTHPAPMISYPESKPC